MEIIFTVLGLVALGFIAGFIICSILFAGERADENFLMDALNELRKELKTANDTIYDLSMQNSQLKDKEVA